MTGVRCSDCQHNAHVGRCSYRDGVGYCTCKHETTMTLPTGPMMADLRERALAVLQVAIPNLVEPYPDVMARAVAYVEAQDRHVRTVVAEELERIAGHCRQLTAVHAMLTEEAARWRGGDARRNAIPCFGIPRCGQSVVGEWEHAVDCPLGRWRGGER